MKLTSLNGEGVHKKEIEDFDFFKKELPESWYGFANVEMLETGTQFDLIIILDDRIMLVDIKDWNGKLNANKRNWYLNEKDMGPSPVKKLAANVEVFRKHLGHYLKEKKGTRHLRTPEIDYCIVMTGKCSFNLENKDNKLQILPHKEFCNVIQSNKRRGEFFGEKKFDARNPLTEKNGKWYQALHFYFSSDKKKFKPQDIVYDDHRITSADPVYTHKFGIYSEYECCNVNNESSTGYIRIWDSANADATSAATDVRSVVSGRELRAFNFLNGIANTTHLRLLQPVSLGGENTLPFGEIFDRDPQFTRLAQYTVKELESVDVAKRMKVVNSLVSNLAFLHKYRVKHLDLGYHCVWIGTDDSVRFSHFLLCSLADDDVLPEPLKKLASDELVMDKEISAHTLTEYQRDVLAVGRVVFHLLTGRKYTDNFSKNAIYEVIAGCDSSIAPYRDWLVKSVSADEQFLFTDGLKMHAELPRLVASTVESVSLNSDKISPRFKPWGDISLDDFITDFYPNSSDLAEFDDDEMTSYESNQYSRRYTVAVWKTEGWDKQKLQNLLYDLEVVQLKGSILLPNPVKFGIIKRHVVAVHDYQVGATLDEFINRDDWTECDIQHLVKTLTESLSALHKRKISNGNLAVGDFLVHTKDDSSHFWIPNFMSPSNSAEPSSDEMNLSPLQRDKRVAIDVLKNLVNSCSNRDEGSMMFQRLSTQIKDLESKSPPFETFGSIMNFSQFESQDTQRLKFNFEIQKRGEGLSTKSFESDDGVFHLVYEDPEDQEKTPKLLIVGAKKHLRIFFRANSNPCNGDPNEIADVVYVDSEQSRIGSLQSKSFDRLHAEISISETKHLSRSSFKKFFTYLEGNEDFIKESSPKSILTLKQDSDADDDDSDSDKDNFSKSNTKSVWDIKADVEADYYAQFDVTDDSVFNEARERHLVNCVLVKGDFEFQPNDRVEVERRRTKRARWEKIGRLDIEKRWSSTDELSILPYLNNDESESKKRETLLKKGDVVRLKSEAEERQKKVKLAAVARILNNDGVICDLIDRLTPSFYSTLGTSSAGTGNLVSHLGDSQSEGEGDGDSNGDSNGDSDGDRGLGFTSSLSSTESTLHIDEEHIMKKYTLNPGQAKAFVQLMGGGPIGLLQGPPGTGKTRFIAAFSHFGISEGHFKNVLIASEAHEAVNNAAEAVLTQFGDKIRLVRVGDEDRLSTKLEPYGTDSLERTYKLQFEDDMESKFMRIGEKLKLPPNFTTKFFTLLSTVKPMLERYTILDSKVNDSISDPSNKQQRNSVIAKLKTICHNLEFDTENINWSHRPHEILKELIGELAGRFEISDLNTVDQMREVSVLASAWTKFASNREKGFPEFLVHTRQIVASTCVGIGNSKFGLADTAFDLVIVDEAAKCNSSQLAVPLQSAKKIILVGDHKQLPPFLSPGMEKELNAVYEERKRSGQFKRRDFFISEFERIFSSEAQKRMGCSLNCQFRMLPPIGRLVSSVFYEPKLKLEHGREKEHEMLPKVCPKIIDKPITWIDTSYLGSKGFDSKEEKNNPSPLNHAESDKIVELLKLLNNQRDFLEWLVKEFSPEERPIGIISGYKSQVKSIRNKLKKSNISEELDDRISIGTVDSYQGKENLIVIYSLVKNNKGKFINPGFLDRPNRMNVALSRARDKLIIVGSIERWDPESRLGQVAAQVKLEVERGNAHICQKINKSRETD